MSEAELSGILTFLFTDLEGSTPLWESHPDLMQEVSARHDARLRAAFEAHRGRVVKTTGDGFHVVFGSPSDGIAAALTGQQAIASEEWPKETGTLKVRMGLHSGESQPRQGDFYGPELNRAARLMGIGHGGQVLLSSAAAGLLRGHLPEGAALIGLGLHRLKGLSDPEQVYQLAHPSLETDFPPLQSSVSIHHNLPTQLTTFIGRERELAEIRRLIKTERLLTLHGPGGTGKTRLMIRSAGDLVERFPDGVWLVELAPLTHSELVPEKAAGVLGLPEQQGRSPSEALAMYLRRREILLLLDNVEHLIQASAELAAYLLAACPQLRIMVTGREPLAIYGETTFQVPSLSVPARRVTTAADLQATEAARLFLDRARAVRPGFELSAQNAAAISQICRRLDGIPLAIELAASRVRMLSAEQIAARLDDRFRLLTGGSRTAMPRQQTLRAMIDWSYSLLSEQEQTLFKRLAVFVGGWTLEAAEAAGSGSGIERFEVLDLLDHLVEKSLVLTEEAAGEMRYHRLETIRQYSREKFMETEEESTVRERHLAYYLQFSEEAEKYPHRGEAELWPRRLEAELDNLRAALEWALASDPDSALHIVGALRLFWNARGYYREAFRWTQRALERFEASPPLENEDRKLRQAAKAKALAGLAWAYVSRGENEQGRIAAEESVALYRQQASGHKRGLALALYKLAQAKIFLGLHAEVEADLKESVSLAREADDPVSEVLALSGLTVMTIREGDLDRAQRYAEEGLRRVYAEDLGYLSALLVHNWGEIAAQRKDPVEARRKFELAMSGFQQAGAPFNALLAKSDLAHLERRAGNHRRALELYRETIIAFFDFGQGGAVAHQLECFAFIAVAQHEFERALRLLGAAEALRERGGTPMTPVEQIDHQKQVEDLREQVAPELFNTTWAAGRALAMEEAVQLAAGTSSTLQA